MTSLNYVHENYRNIKISYEEEDREKLLVSLNCYKSSFTEGDIKNWMEAESRIPVLLLTLGDSSSTQQCGLLADKIFNDYKLKILYRPE